MAIERTVSSLVPMPLPRFLQHTVHKRRNRLGTGLALFSEKVVNIVDTYTFILGADYFSPQHLNASSTTAVHYATKTCGNEATDYLCTVRYAKSCFEDTQCNHGNE